jgi:hypothetical protein
MVMKTDLQLLTHMHFIPSHTDKIPQGNKPLTKYHPITRIDNSYLNFPPIHITQKFNKFMSAVLHMQVGRHLKIHNLVSLTFLLLMDEDLPSGRVNFTGCALHGQGSEELEAEEEGTREKNGGIDGAESDPVEEDTVGVVMLEELGADNLEG